ncbi:MAG: DUF1080 domain-containing protein [Mariniblastus sp.]
MTSKSFNNRTPQQQKSRKGGHFLPNLLWALTLFAAFCCFSQPESFVYGFQKPVEFGPTPGLTKEQIAGGWISLFDGRSLYGWQKTSEARWNLNSSRPGEVFVGKKGVAASEKQRGLLRTNTQFDDFEMVVDFKTSERTNSGIFLRTSPKPRDVKRDCYELNIASPKDHEYSTGALVGRAKCDLKVTPNEWHRFRIICDGPTIKVWIDDDVAVNYTDPNPTGRGYIGLQYNSGDAAFRNIALRPLNTGVLFDGKNLDQWNTNNKLASKFEITKDGELQILSGRGQIESKAQFADFIFSVQCKTNAAGLNSGIFFRCIPGEIMNGYESQIQNEFEGKRNKPADCGTGGIFRRANARLVNADDQKWFSKTIIATGPHVSVWVNGYQVTDWSDRRKPDSNPRRGLRLEKGTFQIQGHDPTTDILMKNIRAKEINPRWPDVAK